MYAIERWLIYYNAAKEYYEKYNNLDIPTNYSINGLNLGTWIVRQRTRKDKLDNHKTNLLNKIGMIWDYRAYHWNKQYELVKQYYETYGDLELPINYTVDGYNLYKWLGTQNLSYFDGKLSKERIKLLEDLGIKWHKQPDWDEMYEYAKIFYQTYGHLRVPQGYMVDGNNLYNWINRQRNKFKQNILGKERIVLLNKIGMIWDYRKYQLLNNEVTKIELKVKRKKLEQILYTVLEECDFDQEIIEKEFIRKLQ